MACEPEGFGGPRGILQGVGDLGDPTGSGDLSGGLRGLMGWDPVGWGSLDVSEGPRGILQGPGDPMVWGDPAGSGDLGVPLGICGGGGVPGGLGCLEDPAGSGLQGCAVTWQNGGWGAARLGAQQGLGNPHGIGSPCGFWGARGTPRVLGSLEDLTRSGGVYLPLTPPARSGVTSPPRAAGSGQPLWG